jgi:hypothetical protein
MKKFSKQRVLLCAAAMTVCALAPSMASAASWSPIGSHNTLDAPTFRWTIDSQGTHLNCGSSFLTTKTANAMDLEISDLDLRTCIATGPTIGTCSVSSTPTGLPWTATPTSATTVDIRNIDVDQTLLHVVSSGCTVNGLRIRWTGDIMQAAWDNATRELNLVSKLGLVLHSTLGQNLPLTTSATFRDTQQTLQILS